MLLSMPWAWLIGKKLVTLYRERGILKENYRGAAIPPALGPALLVGYLPALVVAGGLESSRVPQIMAVSTLLLGACLLGLWDDLLADPVSGFKGHLGALFRGEITAGLLKMVIAGTVGLIFSLALPCSLKGKAVAVLLLALTTNGLNLLDRRPGRALKAFFVVSYLLIAMAGPEKVLWLLVPLLAVALVIAPLDFGARAMLGDSGANLLGAALGMVAVYHLSISLQLALIFLLLVLHIYAEFSSLTRFIERYPLLKYLDRLGCSGP